MLIRLRADPEKIRVSIRNNRGYWFASVKRRGEGPVISASKLDAHEAIFSALEEASYAQWDGVDLDMQRAYEHPWKKQEDE